MTFVSFRRRGRQEKWAVCFNFNEIFRSLCSVFHLIVFKQCLNKNYYVCMITIAIMIDCGCLAIKMFCIRIMIFVTDVHFWRGSRPKCKMYSLNITPITYKLSNYRDWLLRFEARANVWLVLMLPLRYEAPWSCCWQNCKCHNVFSWNLQTWHNLA